MLVDRAEMQLLFQTRDNGDLCSTWLGHLEIYDIYECIYIIHNIYTIYNIIYIYIRLYINTAGNLGSLRCWQLWHCEMLQIWSGNTQ